eukprot:731633-Prymnesium_polylepis.1
MVNTAGCPVSEARSIFAPDPQYCTSHMRSPMHSPRARLVSPCARKRKTPGLHVKLARRGVCLVPVEREGREAYELRDVPQARVAHQVSFLRTR